MKPADDYIADFIKDINRGRVLEVRSIMEKANRATGPKMGVKTPLEDALQKLVSAGKDSGAVIGDNGKTIGKISMANAIAAMARPNRGDEGPRYK
jgi:glycine betaine/proline transport system ATP-binding protein